MLHDAINDNLKVHDIEVTAHVRLLFPTASEVQTECHACQKLGRCGPYLLHSTSLADKTR